MFSSAKDGIKIADSAYVNILSLISTARMQQWPRHHDRARSKSTKTQLKLTVKYLLQILPRLTQSDVMLKELSHE